MHILYTCMQYMYMTAFRCLQN